MRPAANSCVVADVSLILDALKKSEQQRQREKAPGLQSIHQIGAPPAVKPARWRWLAGILVVCNIGFIGVWFWRQNVSTTASVPAAQVAPMAAQSTPASSATQSAVTPAINQSSPPADKTQAAAEFTQISPRSTATQSISSNTSQRIEEVGELPDDVRNNLPAMTFSFHVYSDNPLQRTIIINNRRMREGDEVSAGLQLQQITEDGVVLLFAQHRIHISVLSGW